MKSHVLKIVFSILALLSFLRPPTVHSATVYWIGGSGDWETATNWSAGVLPGPADDVIIGSGPSITVTHSTGADTVNSITSQQAFQLSGGTLTVSNNFQMNGTFTLAGGTLVQAAISLGSGYSLIVSGGTLNGVTVNGTLDVGNTFSGGLALTNGLTLNGTLLLGNPTNSQSAHINLLGSQTLGGNGIVVFGNNGTCNAIIFEYGGTTLTMGSGITIRGQNGYIGFDSAQNNCTFSSPQNVNVINEGVVSCDVNGGTITLDCESFINQGLAQAVNGGSLSLQGNWSNAGTIIQTNVSLNLGVNSLYLSGNGTNDGTILISAATVDNSSGSPLINNGTITVATSSGWGGGGTIIGGTITCSNGASFVLDSGGQVLDGVTFSGTLDVGNTVSVGLALTNGLMLNGTLLLGNPTNNQSGHINLLGSQTLGGNGTVVFGNNSTCNAIIFEYGGTTLTMGSGITIRGQNGYIGFDPEQNNCTFSSPQNVNVINDGVVSCDVNGGTITLDCEPFINQGLVQGINGGSLSLQGNWSNAGTIIQTNASLNLDVNSLYLSGNGTNDGTILISAATVDNSSGSPLINNGTIIVTTSCGWSGGGTIVGGTITFSNGASLILDSALALDGVTFNGTLDVGNSVEGGAQLVIGGPCFANSLMIETGAEVVAEGPLSIGSNIVVDGGTLMATNVQTSCLLLTNGAVITTFGATTTNVCPLDVFVTNEICVSTNSRIDVSGCGYLPGRTSGNTTVGAATGDAGGSYGGLGHNGDDTAGGVANAVYGDYTNPTDWGSGGAYGSSGGGLVRLTAGSLILNGQLLANGQNPGGGACYCGGSGGGIYASVGTLSGTGQIQASGANSWCYKLPGDGGGGRVAIYAQDYSGFNLTDITAPGGNGSPGFNTVPGGGGGTVFIQGPTQASLIIDGGATGGITSLGLPGTNTFTYTVPVVIEGSSTVADPAQPGMTLDFANSLTVDSGATLAGVGGMTLGGNGPVILNNGFLSDPNVGDILTISAGITVRGQSGQLGSNGGGEVVDYGIIDAADGSILNCAGSVALDGQAALISQPGGTNKVSGDLIGNTQNADQFAPQGTMEITSGTHFLEVMSQDRGAVANGYINNFAYNVISLDSGATLELVDESTNSPGPPPECVYANILIVPAGATLNLNGLHFYARQSEIAGAVSNGAASGTISQVPNIGGALTPDTSTGGSISSAGTSDGWTFLGRADEHVTVTLDTGSANVVAPALNYAFVQLFDPSMNLLTAASNATPRQIVALLNTTLQSDGTYTVAISAPASHPTLTGNYLIDVWDISSNSQALAVNQEELGQITTPYSGGQWNFSGVSGEQIQFNLINESAQGIAFTLNGPNGWIGFSNLTSSSGTITLPFDGAYSLDAFGTGGAYGITYAFEIIQNAQTNLVQGQSFTGEFAGNGQSELLAVTVTNSGPLLITLNNAGSGNITALYVQYGSPPTQGNFGWESANPGSPSQQILIPNATAGTYYILVYGNLINTPSPYTVEAVSADVFLTAVSPMMAPGNANINLELSGGGFISPTSVALVSTNGTSCPASAVSVDSFTQVSTIFATNSLPAGLYSVVVTVPSGGSATLSNAVQVLSAGSPNFTSSLIVPTVVAQVSPATAYAVYANTGNAPMPAPLLVLTAEQNGVQGGILGLDSSLLLQAVWTSAQQPLGYGNSAQFLGSGRTPGLLQPGDSFSLPVYWATFEGPFYGHVNVYWNMGVLKADDPTPIDWSSLESAMQPSGVQTDAWTAIFTALTNEVGATWGNYVTTLDNNAYYLGQLGLNINDVTKLLPFEIMQADGLCPIQTLASSVDASVPAPGLPLTFSRSFGERISQRYAMGPLGRGWSDNWQYSLQQGSDGTITIFGPGGSQRIFQPDKRGGYFNQAGDFGTLVPDGTGGFLLTEKTGPVSDYAANGTLNYMQDPNGNRITLGYSDGLLTSLTHSSGQYIHLTYNSANLIQTITDQLGHQTVLTYDDSNQHLIGTQYFDGRTATYIYNTDTNASSAQLHALTASSTSCCNWRYFTYDSLGRLSGTYLANNAEALTLSYGTGGQVTVTDALTNSTQFFYDYRGLLFKTVDPLGNPVNRSFDGSYNLVSITDPTGNSYNYSYDGQGNLVQSTDPMGSLSQFSYTGSYNRLESVKDAKGNVTQYGYDSDGNLQSTTYADNTTESWTYDSFGDPANWTNRRGHETIYSNNANGQITAKQFADGSLMTYAYDPSGDLTNTTTFDTNLNVLEPVSMIYDGSNRLTQINYLGGKFLAFTYDSDNRRISSVDQLGHTLLYYYDDAGRLQSMTNELGQLVVLYQYDPAGRIATKTVGNGMFTTYQYDPAGNILGLTNFLANETVLSFFDYTYDSRGRRITMDSKDGNWTYSYDDIGQLTHAVLTSDTTNVPNQDLTYVYDPVGNRTQTIENGVTAVYTPNNLNEYTTVVQTNYTFDPDGNLIQEVSPEGTTTYAYNDESRLVAVASPSGTWSYSYDGAGDRLAETENGTNTQFVIDPIGLGNLVSEFDSNGNLLTHYDYGLGLFSRSDASGNRAYYGFDANGNVSQLVGSSGSIANIYANDPFGAPLWKTESIPSPFQFNGESGAFYDDDSLNFVRARFYQRSLGRFTSVDPLNLFGDDINFYRFVFNSPPNLQDPSGGQMWSVQLGLPVEPGTLSSEFGVGSDPATGDAFFCVGANVGLGIQGLPSGYIIKNEKGDISGGISFMGTGGSYSSGAPKQGWYMKSRIANGWTLSGNKAGGQNTLGVGFGIGAGAGVGYCFQLPWQLPSQSTNASPNPGTNCYLGGSGTSTGHTPGDPNGLYGPAGYMTANYVVDNGLYQYEIYFENETNATAPAQIVTITDPLSTNLNWSTFQLTEIAFGNTFIPIPPNIQFFETNLQFSYDGVNFQVQIQAGINLANGQVFANFYSIDPATGLPPAADIGFLLPEDGTGRGMGQISYTVQPKPNLPEGLQIPNVAYIQFDGNPVIATDQVNDDDPSQGISTNKQAIVTIDNSNPTSSVETLPYVTTNDTFTVCWSGTNDGPSIVAYDIYVSINGGPWNIWLAGTTNACEDYQGQAGNSYSFYSIAHDGAGQIQQTAPGANTSTIIAPHLPPQFEAVTNRFIAAGQSLVISNSVQDPDTPITFNLGAGAPSGAFIKTNGVFFWTPSCDQASSTNLITIWATDSYSIPLSNSVSFLVVVGDCLQVSIGSTVMQVGTTSGVPVSIISPLGLTNLSFAVTYPANRFDNWAMVTTNSALGNIALQIVGTQTLVNLASQPGQILTGPTVVGSLAFAALPGHSAFVPLGVINVNGLTSDGTLVGNTFGGPGRVVVIGPEPLLEAGLGSNSSRILTLYGNPGTNYQLLFTTNLLTPVWQPAWTTSPTNLFEYFNPDQTSPEVFYRVISQP